MSNYDWSASSLENYFDTLFVGVNVMTVKMKRNERRTESVGGRTMIPAKTVGENLLLI